MSYACLWHYLFISLLWCYINKVWLYKYITISSYVGFVTRSFTIDSDFLDCCLQLMIRFFYCIKIQNLKKSRKFEKKSFQKPNYNWDLLYDCMKKIGDDNFFHVVNKAYPALDIKVNNYIKRPEFTSTEPCASSTSSMDRSLKHVFLHSWKILTSRCFRRPSQCRHRAAVRGCCLRINEVQYLQLDLLLIPGYINLR